MSSQTIRVILAAAFAVGAGASGLRAQDVETHPFPGMTYIKRTLSLPPFQCPGCPAPTPNPRLARINILVIDLERPEIHFKMTPEGDESPGAQLPDPGVAPPPPPFETVRQTTLAFINSAHAQAAINSHFFAPFPVPNGSTQGAYAYLIGLAASRGNVYSGFESPFQSYAIVTNSPGLNIDSANEASIVHRDPGFPDGKHVLENVQLWNARLGVGPDRHQRRHHDPGVQGRDASRRAAGSHRPLQPRRTALVRPQQRPHRHRPDPGQPDAGAVHGGRHERRPRHAGGRSRRPAPQRLPRLERPQPGWRRLRDHGHGKPRDARARARQRAQRQSAASGGEQPRRLLGRRGPHHHGHDFARPKRERMEQHERHREPERQGLRERNHGSPRRLGGPGSVLAGRRADGRPPDRARECDVFRALDTGSHDRHLLRDRRGRERGGGPDPRRQARRRRSPSSTACPAADAPSGRRTTR